MDVDSDPDAPAAGVRGRTELIPSVLDNVGSSRAPQAGNVPASSEVLVAPASLRDKLQRSLSWR